jgi:hypothetical protein
MADHDELLEQGPHEAPEPETAEERSKRLGWGTAGGAVAAGGVAAAKLGAFTKVILWLVAWHGAVNLWRVGGWIGIVLVVLAVATFFVLRARREA